MPTLTAAGVGSGLDINSMISGLMQVERQPLTKLQKQKSTIDVQVSAYGRLKTAISDLVSAAKKLGDKDQFSKYTVSTSDAKVATVSASAGAAAENHTVVVTELAQAHRMASQAYTDADTAVGEGTHTFTAGASSFDITIDAGNNSLKGLRDAINNASGNTGMSASIVNATGGSYLVLTAKNTGLANEITAPAGFGFTESQPAKDAELSVNGFGVTSASNTITGVVDGLTLTLTGKGTTEITSAADNGAMTKSMQDFTSAYNTLINRIKSLRTDDLKGEGMLVGIESSLRSQMFGNFTNAAGANVSAIDFGMTYSKEGVMSVNTTKANDQIKDNLANVVAFFTDKDNGFAKRIADAFERYTQSDGFIQTRTDGLGNRKKSIDLQMERFEARMVSVEARMRKQFGAMDSLVAKLNQTSSFLAQRFKSS
ncbi:MAG: flagellar filament capping protein FliD [Thiotrichales bacterium]